VIGKAEQQVLNASHCGSKQQENLHRAHSISASLHHVYMGVVVHVHPIRGESHIQHKANQEVASLAARLG